MQWVESERTYICGADVICIEASRMGFVAGIIRKAAVPRSCAAIGANLPCPWTRRADLEMYQQGCAGPLDQHCSIDEKGLTFYLSISDGSPFGVLQVKRGY